MSRFTIILDNGHGSNTAGKRSPKLEDGSQLLEYEFVRKITHQIVGQLKEHNIPCVLLVPETNDISLIDRCKRANEIKQKSIFISVHANAAGEGWLSANGVETYHAKDSIGGNKIAKIFQRWLVDGSELRDRGVKEADFYVLKHTNMPAILTECGFYSNLEEVQKLLTDEYVNRFATAHVGAILEIEENGF